MVPESYTTVHLVILCIRVKKKFAIFARRTNSRIGESRENYYYNSPLIETDNSRSLDFTKSPKITNSRKWCHAKITRSTVFLLQEGITAYTGTSFDHEA